MKTYGGWVVSFTPQTLNPRGRRSLDSMGPRCGVGTVNKRRDSDRNWNRMSTPRSYSLYRVPIQTNNILAYACIPVVGEILKSLHLSVCKHGGPHSICYLIVVCSLLGLLFHPEYGGSTVFRNVGNVHHITWRYISQDCRSTFVFGILCKLGSLIRSYSHQKRLKLEYGNSWVSRWWVVWSACCMTDTQLR
jgi:hypothetical protein